MRSMQLCSLSYISLLSIFLFFASCKSVPNLVHTDDVRVPDGWTKTATEGFYHLVAPENDMNIYLRREQVDQKFDFGSKSLAMWKKLDPTFAYEELRTVSPPPKAWDKIVHIVYAVPAEQSKRIISIAKVKNGVGYFTFLESSVSALSRRSAQLRQILESWKPKSIKEKNFSGAVAKDFKRVERKFETFLKQTMQDLEIPGVAIGIVQGKQIVYQKGFGSTKAQGGSPVDNDTLFMVGSTTKPLTTLLMAKLVHEGKLDWDDPIGKHLSGWTLGDEESSKNLLIKHSVCACTGMPRRDLDFMFEIDGISAEKRMQQMASMYPTTKPGETFQYSNYLVAAGGFSAAKAYDGSLPLKDAYKKAMQNLVLGPLGMSQTLVTNTRPYKRNSAYPHSFDFELQPKVFALQLEEFVNSVAPAGSIWSNTTDMLTYIQFELTKGDNLPGYIDKPNLLTRRQRNVTIARNAYYGLGLIVSDHKGIRIVGHGGNTLGFTSEMWFLPKKKLGVVILVNVGGANGFTGVLRGKLFELMFGMNERVAESLAFHKQERAKNIATLKALLKPEIKDVNLLVGEYRSKELGSLILTRSNNDLVADFGEFTSEVREKRDPGEKRVFLLTSPPWSGSIALVQEEGGFTVEAAQEKYVFSKVTN